MELIKVLIAFEMLKCVAKLWISVPSFNFTGPQNQKKGGGGGGGGRCELHKLTQGKSK